MNDLSRSLERLAGAGSRAAGEAPVDVVLARRRRRRAARRSVVATGSVAAGTVLALAGVGLAGGGAALPPATGAGPVVVVDALPTCGGTLPAAGPDAPWEMGLDLPADAAQDVPLVSGEVLLRPAGGDAVTVRHRASALVVVADGVVVGLGEQGAADEETSVTRGEPLRAPVTAVLAECAGESPLAPRTYTVVPAVEVVTDGGTGSWLLGAGRELTVTGSAWTEVGADELPDLPLDGRVLEALRHADGDRWTVTVESDGGRETAGTVRGHLEEAGYRLVSEGTDPERGLWWSAHLVGRYDVVVDVSNETGGGFYVSYEVRER